MRIEALIQSARPGGRLRIRFSDGSTLAVLPSVAADFGLCTGDDLTDAQLSALRAAAAEASAKARAVRIISTIGVTKRDLERRLVQKGESAENAKNAVDWLDEMKLLDDREVARQIVQRGAAKGYGAARIRQMLYEKQVPKRYWDEALAQMPEMDEALDRFLEKKLGGSTDRADVDKAVQAAARRGFSWSEIRSALQRYNANLELEE